ncbi:hypothetical protein LXL04_002192 [Taraxacum kok-saghyz]
MPLMIEYQRFQISMEYVAKLKMLSKGIQLHQIMKLTPTEATVEISGIHETSKSNACNNVLGNLRFNMIRDDPLRSFGVRIDIPDFEGDFIDWLSTVERIFDQRDIPEHLKVKLVAIKLKKSASLWWDHVKKTTKKRGEI